MRETSHRQKHNTAHAPSPLNKKSSNKHSENLTQTPFLTATTVRRINIDVTFKA